MLLAMLCLYSWDSVVYSYRIRGFIRVASGSYLSARSEDYAPAGEFTALIPIDHVVFLVALHLVRVSHMFALLHVITKSHLMRLRSDLNDVSVPVFAKVYLKSVMRVCITKLLPLAGLVLGGSILVVLRIHRIFIHHHFRHCR